MINHDLPWPFPVFGKAPVKSNLRLSVVIVCLLSLSAVMADTAPGFPVGAYSLPDGEILVISDFGGSLRFFTQGGRTGTLKETGKDTYEGSERHLHKEDSHHILSRSSAGIRFQGPSGDLSLKPIALKSTDYYFLSGNNRLRGRLLIPAEGKFQGVVIPVHGSENFSAVDHYYLPYLFAANGLAVFVYDKRGTGESDGKQISIQRGIKDLTELAQDTAAAVDFVASQPSLASYPILLAGYSQGGWIAPIASQLSTNVDAMLLAYGPAVSLHEEDRWGYAYWLEREAYTKRDSAQVDALNEILMDMLSRGSTDRWHEFKRLLKSYRHEPWYKKKALSGTDSTLAAILDSHVPLSLTYLWASLFGFDTYENYDPADTLENITVPSYWLFAGEDSSMPTPGSIDQLSRLAAQGQPIEYKVYPETEHGLVQFKSLGSRDRQAVSYHPDYFDDMIGWLKETSRNVAAASSN